MIKLRLVVAIAIVSLALALTLLESAKEHNRYGLGYGPCLRYLKDQLPEHVDLISLGGSRLLTMISPDEIEAYYKDNYSSEIVVRNMAKSWYGPDYEYQLLKDIYRRGISIDIVLVQLSRQRPGPFHPHGYSFLEPSTIYKTAINGIEGRIIETASYTVWSTFARIRDLIFDAAEEKKEAFRKRKNKNVKTCYPRDSKVNKSKLAKAKEKFKRKGFSTSDIDFEGSNFSYSSYFYKKIIKLASEHGTTVIFVRMPRMMTPRLSDESTDYFQSVHAARVLRFPLALREKLADSGYRDGSHIHLPGREIALPWLIEQLYGKRPD